MPGFLLTMSAVVMCSHGGKGNFAMPNPRVKIMGTPVPMIAPPVAISACVNPPPPVNLGPCVTSTWVPPSGTLRVKSMGQPLICMTTQSITVPTPAPLQIVQAGQMRVKGM